MTNVSLAVVKGSDIDKVGIVIYVSQAVVKGIFDNVGIH